MPPPIHPSLLLLDALKRVSYIGKRFTPSFFHFLYYEVEFRWLLDKKKIGIECPSTNTFHFLANIYVCRHVAEYIFHSRLISRRKRNLLFRSCIESRTPTPFAAVSIPHHFTHSSSKGNPIYIDYIQKKKRSCIFMGEKKRWEVINIWNK